MLEIRLTVYYMADYLQHNNFRTNIVYNNFNNFYYFQDTSKYLMPDPVFCPNNCGRCYRGAGRKWHLNSHVKYECGVPKQFVCTICRKCFAQKSVLKTHYGMVHSFIYP